MQFSTILKASALLAITVASLPTAGGKSVKVEVREQDADEAIAYAWFDEDDAMEKRAVVPKMDADEAIAYAWFDEDDAMEKRTVVPKMDADEAIAYAWFDEDE